MSLLEATYDYETLQISSAEDLAALLDTVASLRIPTWLELAQPDGDVLLIGLGADFSSMRFTEAGRNGQTYHSAATLDSPRDAEFQFGTVPTAMDTDSAVTVAAARDAAAEFQRTGRRPARVEWKLVERTYVEATEQFSWDESFE